MILLVVTREARGSSGWQPKENFYFLSEWWAAGPHRVVMKFDNTVLNDASYSTWYFLGIIMIIIDTPVSFGANPRYKL